MDNNNRIEITAADRAAVSALLDWQFRTKGHVAVDFNSYEATVCLTETLNGNVTKITRATLAEATRIALATEAS